MASCLRSPPETTPLPALVPGLSAVGAFVPPPPFPPLSSGTNPGSASGMCQLPNQCAAPGACTDPGTALCCPVRVPLAGAPGARLFTRQAGGLTWSCRCLGSSQPELAELPILRQPRNLLPPARSPLLGNSNPMGASSTTSSLATRLPLRSTCKHLISPGRLAFGSASLPDSHAMVRMRTATSY